MQADRKRCGDWPILSRERQTRSQRWSWNKALAEEDCDYEVKLPSLRFNRKIGIQSTHLCDPMGNKINQEEWEARKYEWIPSSEEKQYVRNCMISVTELGKFANWITPPARGVNSKPLDFEYVRL